MAGLPTRLFHGKPKLEGTPVSEDASFDASNAVTSKSFTTAVECYLCSLCHNLMLRTSWPVLA